MTRNEFIMKWSPAVIAACNGTTLFPSLFMAQMILESSDSNGVPGNSTLSRVYNNYFGIKNSKDWKGRVVNMKTGEVYNGIPTVENDDFRVYDSPEDSINDRVKFLQVNTNYIRHGVFTATDPFLQAQALKDAGYATSPTYVQTLTSIIKSENLLSLDQKKS